MTESATRPVHRRIAIAFDFDQTLAPDSYDGLLAHLDCDPAEFQRTRVGPLLADGWEEQNAKIYALLQESRRRRPTHRITRELLGEFAAQFDPYPGVTEMFDRLRDRARRVDPEIDVEYFLISSGLVDIPASSRIAGQFSGLWGCELHFAEDGELDFVRRVITHFGKTRYLRLITRVGGDGYLAAGPEQLYRAVPDEELHVPFSQVLYVGDGSSDIPAFALLHQEGGTAIGVRKPGGGREWDAGGVIDSTQRVDTQVAADYAPDSPLTRALTLAVDKVSAQIALRGSNDRA